MSEETKLAQSFIPEMENQLIVIEKFIEDVSDQVNNNEEKYLGISTPNFLTIDPTYLEAFTKNSRLNWIEQIAILLGLAIHYKPQVFNPLLFHNPATKRIYSEYGGILTSNGHVFNPTIQTFLFLIAGNSLSKRIEAESHLKLGSNIFKNNYLQYHQQPEQINWKQSVVYPSEEFLAYLQGEKFEPTYSTSFPAQKITTKMDEEELILDFDTQEKIDEIDTWLKHGQEVLNHAEFGRKVKPGYKALFYGPSGTGKTLTATMLGKKNNLDVYRIDLSMIVSKWVGETEKNLKALFDMAQNKNWILFFDEADAIFGKRTVTQSSNDRYANQEVSYLLQRIEEYPGLIILASNLKVNIDQAFYRRLNNIIYFPPPDSELRKAIWQQMIPTDYTLDEIVTMEELGKIELSGGEILNVMQYCMLKSFERKEKRISEEDMTYAVNKELQKKGKIHK